MTGEEEGSEEKEAINTLAAQELMRSDCYEAATRGVTSKLKDVQQVTQ